MRLARSLTRWALLVSLAACEALPAPPMVQADLRFGQQHQLCTTSLAGLQGTGPEGGVCATGLDCAPQCCSCLSNSNQAFSVAACFNGLCGGPVGSCNAAQLLASDQGACP